MKILFASDIHGSAYWCKKLLERFAEEGAERLVLLGDILYHGPRNELPQGYAPKEVFAMLNAMREQITAVRGNCDAEVDQMVLEFPMMADYLPLWLAGKTVYCTHGHMHSPQSLPQLHTGDVFISGHTHLYLDVVIDGIRCLNPGSVSLAKEDRANSYMLYEDGVFTLKDMDGKPII